MPQYIGPLYQSKGGDTALQRRYDRLRQTVRFHGIEEEASVPVRAKALGLGILDLILRPNYAIAGAAEVMFGNNPSKETVGGRVFRELFSGVGGLKGDKETFGTVLEQAGVPEGGSLSDIVGKNWLTKRIDPTARGMLGLALDIGLDPLTYVTFGAGGAAKAIGRGGRVIFLNKAGEGLLTSRASKVLIQEAVDSSLITARTGAELLAKKGVGLGSIERAVLKQGLADSNLKLLGIWGLNSRFRQVLKPLQEDIVEGVLKGKLKGITKKRAVRFAGQELFSLEGLHTSRGRAGAFLAKTIRKLPNGAESLRAAGDLRAAASDLFNRIPFHARSLEAYQKLSNEHFAVKSSSRAIAERAVRDEILKGVGDRTSKVFNKTNSPEWHLLTMALDNPDKYLGQWIQAAGTLEISAKAAQKIYDNFSNFYKRMFGVETHPQMELWNGLLGTKNYSPHILLEGLDPVLAERAAQRGTFQKGGDLIIGVGKFGKERTFQTYDEMLAAYREMGFTGELKELAQMDPVANIMDRMEAHVGAVIDLEFARDTISTFHVGAKSVLTANEEVVLRHTGSMLTDLNIPASHLETVNTAVHTWKTNPGSAKSMIRSMPMHMKAAFMGESLVRIKSLDELARFMDDFGDIVQKMPRRHAEALNKALKRFEMPSVGLEGAQYITYEMKTKGLAGFYNIPVGAKAGLDAMQATGKQLPKSLGPLLKLTDFITNWTKMGLTMFFPAFHGRNLISNIFASSADIGLAAIDPVNHYHAMRILLSNVDGSFKMKGGRVKTYAEARNEMLENGVQLGRLDIAELTGAGARGVDRIIEKLAPHGTVRGLLNPQNIENEARAVHYISLMRNGATPQDAAMRMKKYLFDYQDLASAEKGFFRRIFPFWTWNTKNIRRQLQNLIDHPGAIAAQAKLLPHERGPDADMMPEYLRGQIAVRIKDQPGKTGSFLTGLDIPINNMNLLWAGGFQQTFKEWISFLNPLIKAPLEIGMNLESFSGRSIKGEKWIGTMGPVMDRLLPAPITDWFQLEKHGNGKYTANGLKMYLIFKAMPISRFASTGAFVDDLISRNDAEEMAGWIRFWSGVQFRDIKLSEAQEVMLKNNVERLEDKLLAAGLARDFTVTHVPKENRQ